jgi:hypothetical protein
MKISFIDFWTGFNERNNFFTNSLNALGLKYKIVKPQRADVIFFSVFGSKNLEFDNTKKIFVLTEDFNLNNFNFDYSIAHQINDDPNNFRLPLWMMYIDWFNAKSYGNPEYLIPVKYLNKSNEFSSAVKSKFCTIVYSSEYFFRDKYIDLISDYKKIDVFGKNKYGNLLPEGEYHKLVHLSQYKFSLAMENEISSGYLCEKLIHAKIAGNIPIFYGDDSAKSDFNPDSFIHITDYSDKILLEKIKEIDCNQDLYADIQNQPLFNKLPNIDRFLEFLNHIVK